MRSSSGRQTPAATEGAARPPGLPAAGPVSQLSCPRGFFIFISGNQSFKKSESNYVKIHTF